MADETQLQVQETEKQEIEQGQAERMRPGTAFVPRADIYETNDAIHVVCDMPGVDGSSVDITLEKNVLTINGSVTNYAPEGYEPAYAEYRVGDYYRQFSVSNRIDQENIGATMQDGVLRLTLPKARPSSIKVSVTPA